MPALGIVLLYSGMYGLQGSPLGCRQTVSQRGASATLFGGKGVRILVEKRPAGTTLREWRNRTLIARALADSSETGTDLLSRYLDSNSGDQEKDNSRIFRRVVYDANLWERHRSSYRFFRHMYTIWSSRIVGALTPPVLTCTIWSILFSVWNEAIGVAGLPSYLVIHVSILPFQLTSSALALLLVFRTNSSYARFDEARKIWGSNVNRTRDISRQALSWIRRPEDANSLKQFLRLTTAYPYTLKAHLVPGQDLVAELRGVLHEKELESVLASSHMPMHVLQMMSNCLASVNVSDIERSAMDSNLTQFHDNTGSCERIFDTPIPISYTRLISRLLVLWHVLLPLGLWDACNVLTPLAIFASAGALFCIDEVAVIIEEPFSILALPALCDGIKSAIEGLEKSHVEWAELQVEETPEPPPAPTYFPLVHLKTAPQSLPWSSIVGTLVWSNLLLGLLWCVKLFYAQRQVPSNRRLGPGRANSKPPSEPDCIEQSSEGSDVYY